VFSLILTIISIALVAVLALAYVYYSGSDRRQLERIRKSDARREALRAFGASFAGSRGQPRSC
jgi:hypothetical protein